MSLFALSALLCLALASQASALGPPAEAPLGSASPFGVAGAESPSVPGASASTPGGDVIPSHYIVVLKNSVAHPASVASAQTDKTSAEVGFVYRSALKGYSATMSKAEVQALERDPRVKYVTLDRTLGIESQTTPTGVERIFALTDPSLDIDEKDDVRVNANVAVIDTGVDYTHPDLNVVGRTNCVPAGENPEDPKESEIEECVDGAGTDGNGHGTHVAGTIGALDNGFGVVGVAPGVRLWSVRVLNNQGSGSFAWILAGVDWVTATRKDENPENDIDVANISIGCGELPCEIPPLDEALTKSAEAGVVYAVAAGNQGGDASESTFGTSPDVITVSALADYDGKPGGKGSPTCEDWGADDTLAGFSNYGKDVEVAAPGVCIYSTYKEGGYATLSGTSMASPHVAGAAAILAAKSHPKSLKDVEAIRSAIIANGNQEWTDTSGDGAQEPLLDVGRIATEPPAIVSETEATLHGRVRPAGQEATYRFEYGTTTAYGTNVPVPDANIGSGSNYVELSQTLKGLKGKTTYHYRITATIGGETFHGLDRTFGTTKPQATTEAASEVHANDATLKATVNPEGGPTSYWFEFGPNTSYGRFAPANPGGSAKPEDIGSGTSAVNASVIVGGLSGNKTYHFRVVAKNSAGMVQGKDQTFTTAPAEWGAEATPDITPGQGNQNQLTAISCTSQSSCMALAEKSSPFGEISERWDGATWSTQVFPSPETATEIAPYRVSCSSSTWCVAVGVYRTAPFVNYPLVEQWDGEKWSIGALPPLPLDGILGDLLGVSCTSASACTVVGSYTIPGKGSSSGEFEHVLIEHWDGSEWRAETADPPHTRWARLLSVSCASSSDCVAVGSYTPESYWHALAEHWDGQEWSVIEDTRPEGVEYPSMYDVSCPAADACTALGNLNAAEGADAARWNGEAWTTESLPTPAGSESGSVSRLSCPSVEFCAATGLAWIPGKSYAWVPAAYAWDGSKWAVQSTTDLVLQKEGPFFGGSGINGVSCVSSSRCMAAGSYIDQESEEINGMVETYGAPGPVVSTKATGQMTMTGAMLNATVNPGGLSTTYQFQYGKTKSYGSLAPAKAAEAGSGSTDVEVAQAIANLKPATTYHYRVLATNSKGTTYGEDKRFTTRGPMPSFSLAFGKLGSGEGQMNEPLGIAIENTGNIWVADTENNRVEKFSPEGKLLLQFGSEGAGNGQFNQPYALAVDSTGNIWVADTFNSRIEKFNSKGEYLSKIGSEGSGNGQFKTPYGLSFDSAGNLWVADTTNQRIQKFNSKGEYLSQFKTSASPTDVAVDPEGNLWVTEYALHRVRKFTPKGEQLIQIGGTKGSGAGQFNEPCGLGVDSEGNLWVADSANGRIQEFNPAGEYLGQFGKAGAGSGEFSFPRDVAFDSEGSAWIADSYNSRLQKWSFGPSAATEAATSVAARSATFHATVNPQGHDTTYRFEYGETTAYGAQAPAAAKDVGSGAEDVDVAITIKDLKPETTYHLRVVAVDSLGLSTYGEDRSFTTKPPMPVFSFAAGSQGSGGGQFIGPEAIAADAKGNVWVLDTYSDRVEEFGPSGEYLSQFGSEGSGSGQLFHPEGIAIDAAGNIWAADSFNSRLEEFNPEGKFLAQVGSYGSVNGKFEIPNAIAINRTSGDIYVGDKTNRVQRFNSKGEYLSQFGIKGTGNGQFEAISGIAVDGASGNVYVADSSANRIQKFNSKGEYLSQFGSKGLANGQFVTPRGMAVESGGNLLVADSGNNRIQKFSSEGKFLGRAGAWGEDKGQFSAPSGIAIDSGNGVWVVDSLNERIQKWTYDLPTATTEAATNVKTTQATLNAVVNPKGSATSYYFEYGTTTSYGTKIPTSSASAGSGTSNVAVSQTPTGLAQGTTYHYRVVATSEAGTTNGADKTLTTLKAPKATTEAATGVKANQATLNAMVNPEGSATSYSFEYGTTTSYGTKIPTTPASIGSGTSNVAVSQTPTGLAQGTIYHYRVVATSEAGTTVGEDRSLVTQQRSVSLTFGSAGSGNGQLSGPNGIAIDSSGNEWVADTSNNRVQKFNSKGEYLSQFGSSGSGNGQLNSPRGITIDSSGNLWVVDTLNHRVQKFNSKGEYLSQFGSKGSGNGQLFSPSDIAVDSAGNVWVADTVNNRVQKFNSKGEYLSQFGSGESGDYQLISPRGIAIDSSGNVWVTAFSGNLVKKFNSKGEYLSTLGSAGSGNGQLSGPNDIAIDSSGDLWVADTLNNRVQEFAPTGEYLGKFGSAGSGSGQLNSPKGIAIDSSGNVWVADTGNNRVQEWIETPRVFSLTFGSAGSGNGQLSGPNGIAIDSSGNEWVADTSNNRVQKFNSKGEYLSQFGSSGSGNGQLNSPRGIAIDSSGNLWVADTLNHRVQKFNSKGEYLSQFGSKGSGNGQLYSPSDIAVDSAGNVWVADTVNNRVEEFNSKGEYLSQFGSKGSENGQFISSRGIATDSAGNLWVTDYSGNRVQKFNSKGEYLSTLGSAGSGNGQLSGPNDIAIDSSGDLWVTDTLNNRVQEFAPTGEYLGKFGSAGSGSGQLNSPKGITIDSSGNVWVADTGNNRVEEWK